MERRAPAPQHSRHARVGTHVAASAGLPLCATPLPCGRVGVPLRAVRLTGSLRAFGAHVTSVLGGAFARARAACASCTEAAPAIPVDADQAGTSCYGNDGANTDVARAMTCVPGSDGANTDVGRAMTCVPLTPASVLRD